MSEIMRPTTRDAVIPRRLSLQHNMPVNRRPFAWAPNLITHGNYINAKQ